MLLLSLKLSQVKKLFLFKYNIKIFNLSKYREEKKTTLNIMI